MAQSFNQNITFPNQKLSDSSKNKAWGEDCVNAAETLILNQNQYTRNSRYSKLVNYDLYAGKLHPSDMELIMNPLGLKDVHFPSKPLNHPLINPYIKSLIGEEIKRRFDYHLKVNNEDAISEKEAAKRDMIQQTIEQILLEGIQQPQKGNQEDEQRFQQEVEKRLRQKNEYLNYEWQDVRELSGNRLLKHYTQKNNLSAIFTQGFEDALICSEEIYRIDVVNNEPVAYKCNPLNTYFLLPPDSNKVEDCDIIIEEDYIPLSKVIDDYYNDLTSADIDWLQEKTMYKAKGTYGGPVGYELQDPTFAVPFGLTGSVNINQINTSANSYMSFDSQNNVRRVKVVWRSFRKVGVLTYLDEQGQSQETIVSEYYVPNKQLGESVRWIWIGEWWEGTKLANNIYVKIQPRPIQFRSLNNISKCASGYVGSIYKTNSSQPVSLVDLMKSSQYMYNVIYHRTQLAFAKNIGKVANLDLAKIPAGWEPEKWIYYMREMNLAVTDSFNEAKKGAATGKIAGNMSNNQSVLDMDMGNYIQQHIQMLEYIKSELDLITGITPERRGQKTSSDQGLGVTQENKLASSNITEWYFRIHDNTKVRVLAALLETAKYCLRNGNKTIQYVEDDYTTQIFKLDGELINECEYDLFIRDAVEDAEAIQMLRKATEIGLQTGKVGLTQLMDIFSNQSLASIRRKIEKSEADAMEQQSRAQQAEFEASQKEAQIELDFKREELHAKMDLEYAKLEQEALDSQMDREVKIQTEQMKSLALDEGPNTGDIAAVGDQALKQQEIYSKEVLKRTEIAAKERIEQAKLSLEREKLKAEKEMKQAEIDRDYDNMINDEKIARINLKGRNKAAKK